MSYRANRFNNKFKASKAKVDEIIKFQEEEAHSAFYGWGYNDYYDSFGGCGHEECCPGSTNIGLDRIWTSFLAGLLVKLKVKSAEELIEYNYTR